MTTPCAGCGMPIENGTAGCRAMFDELAAGPIGSPPSYTLHRLLVDTYSLQHPDQFCASAKSFAAHLTGVCCAFDHASHPSVMEALRRWLDGIVPLEKPTLPENRGALTLALVLAADRGIPQAEATQRWARDTWSAYRDHHALARGWIERALARR